MPTASRPAGPGRRSTSFLERSQLGASQSLGRGRAAQRPRGLRRWAAGPARGEAAPRRARVRRRARCLPEPPYTFGLASSWAEVSSSTRGSAAAGFSPAVSSRQADRHQPCCPDLPASSRRNCVLGICRRRMGDRVLPQGWQTQCHAAYSSHRPVASPLLKPPRPPSPVLEQQNDTQGRYFYQR